MTQHIVITGAGSGLGRAMARRLAADGHPLVLLGRNIGKLNAVAGELGDRALALSCDIASPAAVEATFGEIAGRFGKIRALVNNAGVYRPFRVGSASDAQIREAIETNLMGPIYCARAALPLLERGGYIINVGSETAALSVAMLALYQTAKAGLERFSKSLQQEVAGRGIRVTLIRAGKMYDEDTRLDVPPEIAREFAEENVRLGFDMRSAPISRFESVAGLIPQLLGLPADLHIPEMMLEAWRP